MLPDTTFIVEPEKHIPIIDTADICVVGGSTTGVFAAVRAAMLGAKTIIVEKHNSFGGTATQGLVNEWHSIYDREYKNQIIGGLTTTVLDRLQERGELIVTPKERNMFTFNTEELKIELDNLVQEQVNITPYLQTSYVAPYFSDGKVQGIITESSEGRGAILANCFIDATGDGLLCRDIGVKQYCFQYPLAPTPCAKIFVEHEIDHDKLSKTISSHGKEFGLRDDWGFTMQFPRLKNIRIFAMTHIFNADFSSISGITAADMEGRAQIRAIMDLMKKYMPEVGKIHLIDLYSSMGIRETVHYSSLYKVKEQDLLYGTHFADSIANGTFPVDIHHSNRPGVTVKRLDGTQSIFDNSYRDESRWREKAESYPEYWQIPYRTLLNNQHKNVLMAGRMIDAEQNAYSGIRVMVTLNQLGEAAGVACYLALRENGDVHKIKTQELRKLLADGGSIML